MSRVQSSKRAFSFLLLIISAFVIGYVKTYWSIVIVDILSGIAVLLLLYRAFKMYWSYKAWNLVMIFIIFGGLVIAFPLKDVMQEGQPSFSIEQSVSAGLGMVGGVTSGAIFWVLLFKAIGFFCTLIRVGFGKLIRAFRFVNEKMHEESKHTLSKSKASLEMVPAVVKSDAM